MEKTINLLQNSAIFDNKDEFVITDFDQLEFKLKRDLMKSSAYIIMEIDGTQKTELIKDNKITIDKKFLRHGTLKCTIELRENGNTIKRYSLEPLKIVKLETTYKAIPEVEDLRKEVATLKKEVETSSKLVKNLYGIKIGG